MKLFDKAKKILSTDRFDRKRFIAARALYRDAKGKEKKLIGQMMESQIASVEDVDDVMWLNSLV